MDGWRRRPGRSRCGCCGGNPRWFLTSSTGPPWPMRFSPRAATSQDGSATSRPHVAEGVGHRAGHRPSASAPSLALAISVSPASRRSPRGLPPALSEVIAVLMNPLSAGRKFVMAGRVGPLTAHWLVGSTALRCRRVRAPARRARRARSGWRPAGHRSGVADAGRTHRGRRGQFSGPNSQFPGAFSSSLR